jgi:acetyl esterase/lipase
MRMGRLLTAGALGASLLSACSPASLFGAIQPPAPGGEVADVAYGAGPRRSMDLYLPAASGAPAPVVVFFYGGRWEAGDRAAYRFVGRALAGCGAMVVVPDYRVWPEAGYKDFLTDAAAAVASARTEAVRRGGDPSRLYLMGHSAGAYIAAMLSLDPEWLGASGLDPRRDVAGMIGVSGPYDFLPLNDPVLEQIFAPVGPSTQPITFAGNARAPMLLLSGGDDTTVLPRNSERLAARARAAGADAEVSIYPGVGHVGIIAALGAPLRGVAPTLADTCRFLGLPRTRTTALSAVKEAMAR